MNDPLASRIRPQELSQVVGQRHLLAPGKPLYNMIESGNIPNLIFYGPSGTGKTTVASIIAKRTNRTLFKLNGTNASTKDIKDIVSRLDTFETPNGVLLYLDEIQYFNKRQQQSLLEYIENGKSHLSLPPRKILISIFIPPFFRAQPCLNLKAFRLPMLRPR